MKFAKILAAINMKGLALKEVLIAVLVFACFSVATLSGCVSQQGSGREEVSGKQEVSKGQASDNGNEKCFPGGVGQEDNRTPFGEPQPVVKVPRLLSGHDEDEDGIDDLQDIVEGARAEAFRKPAYKNAYYSGGYPPDDEGVCTDVIWRAFRDAGYDLKAMVDRDIKNNKRSYPRVEGRPDPNIDFRRVPNLVSYFKRHADSLTTEIIPGDKDILAQWQGGDIVVYGAPLWHIGIVSDRRREDGVPLLIHNGGPFASESDVLMDWPSPIINHFRFPRSE